MTHPAITPAAQCRTLFHELLLPIHFWCPREVKSHSQWKRLKIAKNNSVVQTCEDNACVIWNPFLLKCPKMAPFYKVSGPKAQMEWLLAGSLQHSLSSIQQILHFPAFQKQAAAPTRWMELPAYSEEESLESGGKDRLHLPQNASAGGGGGCAVGGAGIHPSIHWEGCRNTPWAGHHTGLLNPFYVFLDWGGQKHQLKNKHPDQLEDNM